MNGKLEKGRILSWSSSITAKIITKWYGIRPIIWREYTQEAQLLIPNKASRNIFQKEVGLCTSSSRASRGRKFQKEKNYKAKKNLPIECAQGDEPVRCPNGVFVRTSVQPFHGGDVTCFDVMRLVAG